MIGMDKPCEFTCWRMVAVMSYCLNIPFSHSDALKHKLTIRAAVNAYNKRPRPVDLPRIVDYTGYPAELDAATSAFAYGNVLPSPMDSHTAAAHSVGSLRWRHDCVRVVARSEFRRGK